MSDYGFLVPIVFLLSFAGFFCVRLRYRHLDRLAAQETIRGALERGQPLTPELVAATRRERQPERRFAPRRDLDCGCDCVLRLCGSAVGEDDAFGPMTGNRGVPVAHRPCLPRAAPVRETA